MSEEPPEQPIKVVKGDPAPEELAAVVAVLSAKAAEAGRAEGERPSTWAWYWRSVRAPIRPGPGAWRASGLPR